MSGKTEHILSRVNLSDTLSLTEIGPTSGDCGFWLWDETRGMNLAVRAKTREDALLTALRYYQKYLTQAQAERDALRKQVDGIREILHTEEEDA